MARFTDKEYFARRAAEEIRHGELATSAKAAAAHFEMALRYAMVAAESPDNSVSMRVGGNERQLMA